MPTAHPCASLRGFSTAAGFRCVSQRRTVRGTPTHERGNARHARAGDRRELTCQRSDSVPRSEPVTRQVGAGAESGTAHGRLDPAVDGFGTEHDLGSRACPASAALIVLAQGVVRLSQVRRHGADFRAKPADRQDPIPVCMVSHSPGSMYRRRHCSELLRADPPALRRSRRCQTEGIGTLNRGWRGRTVRKTQWPARFRAPNVDGPAHRCRPMDQY